MTTKTGLLLFVICFFVFFPFGLKKIEFLGACPKSNIFVKFFPEYNVARFGYSDITTKFSPDGCHFASSNVPFFAIKITKKTKKFFKNQLEIGKFVENSRKF